MKKITIYIIIVVLAVATVAWLWLSQDTESNGVNQNIVILNQSSGENSNPIENTDSTKDETQDEIVLSEQRSTAPSEPVYEEGSSGQQCWVFDLNDYTPSKDEVSRTYTWIIELPNDDCVIGKPATNLPETLSETINENIQGTNYRRVIVSYE